MQQENLPVETTDGFRIKITTRIFSHTEVEDVLKYGPEGIGLFSTDYLFENRNNLPPEEYQYKIYHQVGEIMKGNPVGIRVLNSPPPYIPIPQVKNPALGFWGTRLGLCHPEVLKTQFRAILRANTYGNLKILLSGIAHFTELLKTKEILSRVREELEIENIPYKTAEVGIVAETPSAVFNVEKIGNEASFFCISPDLINYISAVDPSCQELSYLYDKFDPVFLRMAQSLTETGQKRWKEISIYGPLTGQISAIAILLAMGLNELIVDAPEIPKVKKFIRMISMMEAKKITAKALSYNTADQVEEYAQKSLAKLLKQV